MGWIVLAAALVLAFANGANDNMKGVATLYGSGQLSYRRSLALATVSTGLGSLASVVLATALIGAFSGKGLVPASLLTPGLLAAVAIGAALTVLVATRLGAPISTTHALVGGLAGAGWVAAGPALHLAALGGVFILPLFAGPLMAVALAWMALRGSRAFAVPRVSGGVGEPEGRESRQDREVIDSAVDAAVKRAHLLSASAVGFARGLNDTPKILGLVVGASVLEPTAGAASIAFAMAIGGVLASRRVTETMAHDLTPMSPGQGLAGNLATSLLVIGASRLGLPVSTTHVSAGGIFGVGVTTGGLQRRAFASVLTAWILTLPAAAAVAAGSMTLILRLV